MTQPYTIRWGIMATGRIARTLAKDLLINPKTRDTTDIIHTITAVASSTSMDVAQEFVSEIIAPTQGKKIACRAYASYEELVKDPDVDIIYIATPHSCHFQNCMLALSYNKPVLCEKPFTVNARQAKIVYSTAKEKNIFIMEGLWTRYFPLSKKVREVISNGSLGNVLRVTADISVGLSMDAIPMSSRMVNPKLAGGGLLDIGIYPLTWVFQTLYHTVPSHERKPPKVVSAMSLYKTGVDQMTSMILDFPKSSQSGSMNSHGIVTAGGEITDDPDGKNSAGPAVRIYGTKGEIQVFPPAYRPTRIKIIPRSDQFAPQGISRDAEIEDLTLEIPAGGEGMFWEADEAARCIRDGKIESEIMPWEESIAVLEVMDQVRQQCGLKYSSMVESTDYP